MEKLRLFAVSSITKPPVEFSRKKDKQLFKCTLTLPIPPQLLIFNQGQWPPGDREKDATLDIYLDSEKIGEMDEETKCFAWEADSLEGRPAGDKILLEIKVIGMKTPTEQSQAQKNKKGATLKKAGKASSLQKHKEVDKKEVEEKDKQPLADISKNSNSDSEKMDISPKAPEKSKSPKLPPSDSHPNSGKDKSKDKPEKRKKYTEPTIASDKKKSTPPTTYMKKTRQTQLNFSGSKKVSLVAETQKNDDEHKTQKKDEHETQKKDDEQDEASKNRTTLDLQEVVKKVRAVKIQSDQPRDRKDGSPELTTDVGEDGRCEAQVLNESTPQMRDMPSPLPRKPMKKKRQRGDSENSPDGPTPKKRGTRMRALTSEGTPKSSRSKAILSDSPFKENMTPAESAKTTVHSDGQLMRCVDLSARVPRPSARWGHTVLLTRPHCAVLIGGQGDRQQLSKDSVWTLNTDTRKWQSEEVQSEGQKPENRMGHTATYDPTIRCVYVFGGSKTSRWFHDVHVYDLDENKWTLTKVEGKAPTRAYHTANLHRHELWIFGGVYPRPDPNPDGCSNEIHIFSPVMQSWYSPIVQGDKPLPRSGHSATLIKDQLVMFGGWDAPFCYNDLFILDMTTVDWSEPDVKGKPPKPRSWHASCALSNQRILIHGGYDGNEALDDTFIFDLDGLSWSRLVMPDAPKARAGHAAVSVPYSHENQEEDEVLVFGGGDNDGEFFSDLLALAIPFRPVVELP